MGWQGANVEGRAGTKLGVVGKNMKEDGKMP